MKNYYKILGVSEKATPSEIEKAYKSQAIKFHPDKNHGFDTTDMFKSIQEAYNVLKTRQGRSRYDWEFSKFNTPNTQEAKESSQDKQEHSEPPSDQKSGNTFSSVLMTVLTGFGVSVGLFMLILLLAQSLVHHTHSDFSDSSIYQVPVIKGDSVKCQLKFKYDNDSFLIIDNCGISNIPWNWKYIFKDISRANGSIERGPLYNGYWDTLSIVRYEFKTLNGTVRYSSNLNDPIDVCKIELERNGKNISYSEYSDCLRFVESKKVYSDSAVYRSVLISDSSRYVVRENKYSYSLQLESH